MDPMHRTAAALEALRQDMERTLEELTDPQEWRAELARLNAQRARAIKAQDEHNGRA